MANQNRQTYSLVISSAADGPASAEALDAVYRKLSWRLMPLFCMCIMLNYLDRTSLSFASIQMTKQLQFSPEVLGLGGGLFFVSYCLMQVPCNIICMRVGVTRWLSCIMLCWGLVAALFAAVQHRWQFYTLRLLLGLAEAGTFPAVWYGISLWFPPSRTSVPYALLNASVAVSQMITAPVAAGLLQLDGVAGLAGWQWVFLGEGVPSVAAALLLPCLLPEGPGRVNSSRLLSQAELQLLQADRELLHKPPETVLATDTTTDHGLCQSAATVNGTALPAADLSAAWADSDAPRAAAKADAMDFDSSGSSNTSAHPAAPYHGQLPQKPVLVDWHLLLRVVRVWQIWYLACTEAVKGMSVMALMFWLPVMVNSLLSGGDPTQLAGSSHPGSTAQHSTPGHSNSSDSTGALPVLLTAIPFTCAAVTTTTLGALAQRTGRPLVYNLVTNLVGGAAFLVFPWAVHANRVSGFIMLTVALACGYASSPHPVTAITQIVSNKVASQQVYHHTPTASSVPPPSGSSGTALALPMYNTVAMLGGFFGPWLLGVAVERLGGFSAGSVAMGVCMVAAGVLVWLLLCLHAPTAHAGLLKTAHVSSACQGMSTELVQQAGRCIGMFSSRPGAGGSCASSPGDAGIGSLQVAGDTSLRLLSGARRKVSKAAEDAEVERGRLLPASGISLAAVDAGVHDDACVSHESEVVVGRDGSSPRMRWHRSRPTRL